MYCPECELEVREFKGERCPFCQTVLVENPPGDGPDDEADPKKLELKELISDVKRQRDEIDSLPDKTHPGAGPAGTEKDSAMEEVQLPDVD